MRVKKAVKKQTIVVLSCVLFLSMYRSGPESLVQAEVCQAGQAGAQPLPSLLVGQPRAPARQAD